MATFTVTNLDDAGAGSLRAILDQANTAVGADSIVFQAGLSGTITLTSGELSIEDSVTITGSGITISGGNTSRIFNIDDLNESNILDVTLSGMTLKNGYADKEGGGAILCSSENLTLADAIITGSRADIGGGILLGNGNLTIQNSQILGNTAYYAGGGVLFEGGSNHTLTITNSQVIGNFARVGGGVLVGSETRKIDESLNRSTIAIQSSTIVANKAIVDAGGLGFVGSYTDATITDSTISGNIASNGGGILFGSFRDEDSIGSSLTILSSEISGNVAVGHESYYREEGDFGRGAGILASGSALKVTIGDSTLSGNITDGFYSAILFEGDSHEVNPGSSTLDIYGSKIYDNQAQTGTLGAVFFGGLANTFKLTDSCVYDNTATSESAGIVIADIFAETGILATIQNSNIVNNRVLHPFSFFEEIEVGGVNFQSMSGNGVLTIRDSIIANNNGSAGDTDLVNLADEDTGEQGTINVTQSWIENQGDAINGSNTDNVLGLEPNTVTVDIAPTPIGEGGAPLIYTFTRTGPATQPLTVNFVYSGTATFNADYTQNGATSFADGVGSVTFAANASTATVTLTALTDSALEGSEVVTLTITDGLYLNCVEEASEATGTILDAAPTGLPQKEIKFPGYKKGKGVRDRGSSGKDDFSGTDEDDILKGQGGRDTVNGKGGDDRIVGDAGKDILKGAGGNDVIDGGAGDDQLIGGGGKDKLSGKEGDDILLGQGGRDILIGGQGSDTLSGGGGVDTFVFNNLSEGIDTIKGFKGDLIDLRGILSAPQYTAVNDFQKFTQYIQLTQVGSNTELRIDSDGNGDGTLFTTLAVLKNVTATSLTSTNLVIS